MEIFSLIVESSGAPLLVTLAVVFGFIAAMALAKLIFIVVDMWRRRRRHYGSEV